MLKVKLTSSGFTIVELLIVIVVIAILAAISIIAYTGVQGRAHASSASSSVSQAARQIQLFFVENESYPTTLEEAGLSDIDHLEYDFDNATNPPSFCVTATSGSKSFYIDHTNPSTPVEGACAGHSVGGREIITNLATNPKGQDGEAILSNNPSYYSITKNVTVPATPDGISTAVESRHLGVSGSENAVLSLYNIDGLYNSSGIQRSISAWVRVNAEGYAVNQAESIYFHEQELPPNTWVRIQTATPVPGDRWGALTISKTTGLPDPSDRAWLTGIMVVEGSGHYSFADGDTAGWSWNGTPNRSSSTGPRL